MTINSIQSPSLSPRPSGELQNVDRSVSQQNDAITVEYEVIKNSSDAVQVKQQDGFENFLEDASLMTLEKTQNDGLVFDTAGSISENSVYKEPGKDFPV